MTGATPPASNPSATARPIAATRSGRDEKARVPMALCMPSPATSSTGAQSMVIPTSMRSYAMRRATRPAVASAREGSRPASIAANAFPERPRQRAHLIAVGDVALEENEAPGVFLGQESAFLIGQRETRAAANEGLGQFATPRVGRERAASLRLLSDEALPALAFEARAHCR